MTRLISFAVASLFALGLSSAAMSCEFNNMAEHNMSKIDTAQLEEEVSKDKADQSAVKAETIETDKDSSQQELARIEPNKSFEKN